MSGFYAESPYFLGCEWTVQSETSLLKSKTPLISVLLSSSKCLGYNLTTDMRLG